MPQNFISPACYESNYSFLFTAYWTSTYARCRNQCECQLWRRHWCGQSRRWVFESLTIFYSRRTRWDGSSCTSSRQPQPFFKAYPILTEIASLLKGCLEHADKVVSEMSKLLASFKKDAWEKHYIPRGPKPQCETVSSCLELSTIRVAKRNVQSYEQTERKKAKKQDYQWLRVDFVHIMEILSYK